MTPEQVQAIASEVEKTELSDDVIAKLRKTYPKIHFTYCMEDDITNPITPVVESKGFNVYLVGGDGHCLAFTKEYETATGLVLAEVIEE
ncbi:DUF6129 family protein [Candidatus Albibeggiatoa sp. nov. NOAA]|uniref:DUF6129 family protein n=1 Tax=Candidatus Albibeggiatoa sp. nov. NOAA TaxID=3162724 RepID=UPI0032FC629C|nr:DUF6129 family protein [Thiotrichaceae bacterium]